MKTFIAGVFVVFVCAVLWDVSSAHEAKEKQAICHVERVGAKRSLTSHCHNMEYLSSSAAKSFENCMNSVAGGVPERTIEWVCWPGAQHIVDEEKRVAEMQAEEERRRADFALQAAKRKQREDDDKVNYIRNNAKSIAARRKEDDRQARWRKSGEYQDALAKCFAEVGKKYPKTVHQWAMEMIIDDATISCQYIDRAPASYR